MRMGESIKDLATALAKAQGELQNVTRDSKNPHFKNNYASLEGCCDAIRPVLSKHGLSLVQTPSTMNDKPALESWLFHSSGQFIEFSVISLLLEKPGPQGFKSAVTYMRRTQMLAICGIGEEEDDGHAATEEFKKQEPAQDTKPLQNYAPKSKFDPMICPCGDFKGTHISKIPELKLKGTVKWCKDNNKFQDFVQAAESFLKGGQMPEPPPGFIDDQDIPF